MVTGSSMRVVATILAAGRSTRMGETNKLLENWQGKPLVAHVVDAALASIELTQVVAVTGHQADQVAKVVEPGVATVHNPHFATGMASSLKTAIAWSTERKANGVLVLLGDMPLVTAAQIDAMLGAFAKAGNEAIIQATNNGEPGNPVLLPASLFDEILQIDGDRGARSVIETHAERVVPVEIGPAAARDFDTPQAFEAPAS